VRTARLLLFGLLAVTAAAACTGLKGAEINISVNTPEGGSSGTSETPGDDARAADDDLPPPPDAGSPPDDFSCDRSVWTLADKPRAECLPRRVTVVSPTPIPMNRGVSIARTTTGRIGISYNYDTDAETSKLRVAHFVPTAPDFPTPVIITRESPDFQHAGYVSRIVASAPDTFHVLSFDLDSASNIGSVNSQKLVDGAGPLTAPELVVADVPSPTEIGYAIDSTKTSYALVRLAVPNDKAKMLAFQKPNDGDWSSLPNLPSLGYGLLPKEAPAAGASSLVVDPNDRLHVLYHHNEVRFGSTPRYHVLANNDWTYRKTIDNNTLDGWCGFSLKLGLFGSRKYGAYFCEKAPDGVPDPNAELRLSSWVSDDDTPTHEIVDQQIPSKSSMNPRYRVAMAIDRYGLVHLAIVRPSPDEGRGYLEYKRQQRVVGGGTRWLSDIVDDDVLSDEAGAEVAMLVDENARPHIAYVSGKDLLLRYATRFDR
jgi:hypothetical protein